MDSSFFQNVKLLLSRHLPVLLASAGVILILGTAGADEPVDLNKKILELEQQTETLRKQVMELEENQKSQAEAVEEIREASVPEEGAVNIGGHFKFFPADYAEGERNEVDQDNNLAAGISDLWFYVSKNLTEWLSFDVAPKVEVLASATPGLGSDISRSSDASVDIELDEAYVTMRLPYEVEVKAGAFYPYFSEEYARQSWWHEQYHGNNGLLTLQNWQSSGFEIYRNFDFENFSLPVYFYPYLNGEDRSQNNDSRFTDNNSNKNILVHLAPETYLLGGRIRALGSLGTGRWDDDADYDSWQYALGVEVAYRGLNVLGEYLRRERENWPLADGGRADGDDDGWYVRGMYTFNTKWRGLVKYSDVDLFFATENSMLTDSYKTFSMALNYWIAEGSTIIPQVEYVDADRTGSRESLEYIRWTLGWRTTF